MPSDLHIRDEHPRVAALARASRSLSDLVDRDPEALALVVADEPLPDGPGYVDRLRRAHEADGWGGLRTAKHRLLAQIAAHDLVGDASLEEVCRCLTALADACFSVAVEAIAGSDGFAVVALGKLGGRELNYSSDVDVVFVSPHDPGRWTGGAERLLAELGSFAPEGQAFRIDTSLRPEGRHGAL